jgi:pimeloyl-ACP methyl ester carboxylesterase
MAFVYAMPAAAARQEREAKCSEVNFTVSLDGTSPPSYRVAGQLCRPHGDQAQVLELLIHGSTCNRTYWDFPYMPEHYSYVRHANRAGFATLAIDRLGSGASDHPPAELVTVHATANAIHEIVTAVRAGSVSDTEGHRVHFSKVILVGHSFGSNISWTEAGTYGDVDGVILTAISHDQTPPAAPLTVTDSWPAEMDPKFAGAGFPPGYLTNIPGKRGELFYYLPGTDPQVLEVDEANKDVLPFGVLLDQFTTYDLTRNIHVPVLNVVGNYDTLACELPSCLEAGTLTTESSYYSADACYTLLVVPNTGHSTNLHEYAPWWYKKAQHWVRHVVAGHDGAHGHCPQP